MMQTQDYLRYIAEELHTVVLATTDDAGLPVTAAIDIMDSDPHGLYFLTARGKSLYERLSRRGFAAFTAVKGADTMHSVAVSVRGQVRELGQDRLDALFAENPYMFEIYPTRDSMQALTVFQMYAGSGEWFDLSKKPIERASFRFGGVQDGMQGYRITDRCTGCGRCGTVCPQNCIDLHARPAVIVQAHCLHCGNCMRVCPAGAVERSAVE